MLPSQVYRILVFFDAIGFNGSTKLSERRVTTLSIYFVHISLALLLTFYKFHLVATFLSQIELSLAISEFVQYFICLCSYWLIIMDSALNQRSHVQFWAILEEIYQNNSHCIQFKFTFRIYILKFVEFFVVTISITIAICIVNGLHESMLVFSYAILIKLCQVRAFYYIFCLEVIHLQLKIIFQQIQYFRTNSFIFKRVRFNRNEISIFGNSYVK